MKRTKLKLRLGRETIRELASYQLGSMNGGISLHCSRPGNSLCAYGCDTGLTCNPCE